MIVFPNAKINLGLNIVEKRPDGYHNLETVFYPIPWKDALEVKKYPRQRHPKYALNLSGRIALDNSTENLVVKACKLLNKEVGIPDVDIWLYKNIPSGAGLGGGSSDAAFTLKLLNSMFNLCLSDEQLELYAGKLGADCAFFIKNQPVYAEGIGNIFTQVNLTLKGYRIVVVKPGIFVSTQEAFSTISPHKPACPIPDIIKQPIEKWKGILSNDFEESVFPRYPEIAGIKETLYNNGAIYASMSGSGSSVYGIFSPDFTVPSMEFAGMDSFHSTL